MSGKLRLLLVTDAVGGVWVYSLELARALRAHGVETILAVMGPEPNAKQRAQASGFRLLDTGLPLDWMPTSPGAMRRAGEAIAALARAEGADIVQTCSAALLADCEFDQPCIAVQHSCVASWWSAVRGTPLPGEFAWRRDLVECGLNRASAIVAPTAAFAAETSRMYDLCRPVMAIHNGRHPVVPSPVPQSDFVFTASRLWDEGKNICVLDAAAANIGVPFQAAGPVEGPNGARGHFDNLQLLGEISESRLAGLLAARPVYASAALYEPFGLSVLEAAFAGCALLLSDIPTHRELWRGAARFVPADDPEAFREAANRLIADPAEREALGQVAALRARAFTPEAMAERMAGLYFRTTRSVQRAVPLQMAGAA
jgi:glycosyltransferase involved in cell wall biosynthesis